LFWPPAFLAALVLSAAAVLSGQLPDGSWPAEVGQPRNREMMFGNAHTSALAVLTLTPAFQLLPVYQR
jgi:hypothetical protein